MRAERHGLQRALLLFATAAALNGAAPAQQQTRHVARELPRCRRAVVQATVHAGQGFQQMFARGLVVGLEPIRSGWALRVVAADKPRGAHDRAEIATLPYLSVSPLLLSTDWAFRAQDAVGWTPRRFHYAATDAAYAELLASYDAVVRGDAKQSAHAAEVAEQQPGGEIDILDAIVAPGSADQTRMAAAVSAHFPDTPHTVDTKASPSPLGRVEDLRVRINLDLPPGLVAAPGTQVVTQPCVARPTVGSTPASHSVHSRK